MVPDKVTCITGENYEIYYYFDRQEGRCSPYTYIGGGAIPFRTLGECEACACHLTINP
ncbi:BPTI domain-containing protein [Aureispira anguillae]|nr:hypothetical protein [Aureispira anguillae]